MEYPEWKEGRWEFAKIILHFSFEKETFFQTRLFAMAVMFLLKSILSTYQFDRPLNPSTSEMGGWGPSW